MNLLVFCTCPDEASASRIAAALVDEALAACVSRLPGLTSTWRWEGAVQEGTEILLLIKTRAERFAALEARVVALHPYAVPELVALPIERGHAPYLDWLAASTGA